MLVKDKDGGAGHGGFLDRSKVRILLCDNDAKSSEEILYLLAKCSYQVTSVRTARQVVDVINAQGPDIDIILAEVDLPTTKGLKMLKYITRNVELRRIPIIMMSSQDEVSVVVKCLRLGAADYLVKPLRTNELLNLWTHMWRRRRMVGLTEKSMISNDFDLLVSDHSDANTTSATLFSDDTDDKLVKALNPEPTISNQQIYESSAPCTDSQQTNVEANRHSTAETVDHSGFSGIFSRPKKTDLRIGETSAFLTYVRSSVPTGSSQVKIYGGIEARSQDISAEEKHFAESDTERCPSTEVLVSHSNGTFGYAGDRTCDANPIPSALEAPVECASTTRQPPLRKEDQVEGSKVPLVFPMPMYFTGSEEQSMTPSNFQIYPVNLNNVHMHTTPPMVSQHNMLSQCPHPPIMMPSYPYYPIGINLPALHVPGQQHLRSSTSSSSTPDAKSGQMDRREAALIKFRQKRKERCFDKKIRYVNRKKLAERRPRIRGQFVRHAEGLDAHPNDFPNTNDEWDEEEEEHLSREIELDSSPEPGNSEC